MKKVKDIVPQTYVTSDINVEEVVGTFHEKEFQKTNQTEYRVEKAIQKKGDKLYVTWKGYINSFSNQIDKKDIAIYNELFSKTIEKIKQRRNQI